LLHDISKRGNPDFKGKDHIHPFVSAAMTLRVFRKFGIIKIETKEQEADFEKVLELIMASKQPVQVVWPEVRPEDNLC
jgi:hypothetical protein